MIGITIMGEFEIINREVGVDLHIYGRIFFMAQSSRTFRVFVSSTFSDLKAERNALQENVFPRLRELAAAHGCRFQGIDLRWGVSEEASLDQQTMNICLGEIERCQKISPRPNFIVLLGNRYGWRPLPYEIDAQEFERILLVTSAEDKIQLDQWYRRDDNAIPAKYTLQPRSGKYDEFTTWKKVEINLHQILLTAAEKLLFPPEVMLKYTASATEQEIISGALQVSDAKEHVFCFLRDIEGMPDDGSAENFMDVDLEDRQKQEKLKNNLRKQLSDNVHRYTAFWRDGEMSDDHLEQLCEDVYDELSKVILNEIERLETIDPLEREISTHEVFGKERARDFVGRSEILKSVADYVNGNDSCPLVIWGSSGSGKSALIAKAIQQSMKDHPRANCIYRFIGATPESSNERALLESLYCQIASSGNKIDIQVPSEYNDLVREFSRCLKRGARKKPILLFLDALDQLVDSNGTPSLTWLPAELPPKVKIIISTLPGPYLDIVKQKLPKSRFVELQSMATVEGATLLDMWLAEAQRTLQPEQHKYLINKFSQCGLPLYLRLAFESARYWRSYEQLPEISDDVPGLIRDMIASLSMENKHGKTLVERSLGYLAAAKNGLSEDELVDILSADAQVLQDFHRRSPKSPSITRLPVVVWSRLFFDLDPYLTERMADGAILMTFYHRQLAEVVTEDILSISQNETHQRLANYFGSQELQIRKQGIEILNLRKLSELPFHQTVGKMWAELESTLCNLHTIEAMCRASRIYELISDYNRALAVVGIPQALYTKLQDYLKFLRAQGYLLAERPALTLQLAANQVDSSAPAQAAHEYLEAGYVTHPWLRWINKPQQVYPADLSIFSHHEEIVRTCAFSPDGSILVSGSDDKKAMVWDTFSGRLLATLNHDAEVNLVRFSPDGKSLITASGKQDWWGEILVWDVATRQLVKKLPLQRSTIDQFILSDDNKRILTVVTERKTHLRIFDLESDECVSEQHYSNVRVVELISACPGRSQLLLINRNKNTGEVLNSSSLEPITRFELGSRLHESQFAALLDEKNMIYAFILGSSLILYDGANSSIISETQLPYIPHSFCISSDERQSLFIAGVAEGKRNYGGLTILDKFGKMVGNYQFPNHNPYACAYSPTDSRIAVGLENGEIHCWKPTVEMPENKIFDHVPSDQYIMAVSSDELHYLTNQIAFQPEKYPENYYAPVGERMVLLAALNGEELRSCTWDDLIADGMSHHFIKLACFSPDRKGIIAITTAEFDRPIISKDDKIFMLDAESMKIKWSTVRPMRLRNKYMEFRNRLIMALSVVFLIPLLLLVILGHVLHLIGREFYPKQFQRVEDFFEELFEKLTTNVLVQPWWKRVHRGAFAVLPDITPDFVETKGKEQVLVSNGSNLIALDINTGEIVSNIYISKYGISSFAVAPDHRTVACCTLLNRDAIQLVDMELEKVVKKMTLPVAREDSEPSGVVWEIPWCGFSPDGKYFAAHVTSDAGGSYIHFWSSDLVNHVCQISVASANFAWSPDSRAFCVWETHLQNRLTIWSIPDANIITEFNAEGWPVMLEWTKQGETLLAATRDGGLYKLKLEGGQIGYYNEGF